MMRCTHVKCHFQAKFDELMDMLKVEKDRFAYIRLAQQRKSEFHKTTVSLASLLVSEYIQMIDICHIIQTF